MSASGSTGRRASQAAAAFGRALPATPPVSRGPRDKAPVTSTDTAAKSKYTVLLSPDEALTLDRLALSVRASLGRRVEKSAVIRALIGITGDDPTLLAQVVAEIGRQA